MDRIKAATAALNEVVNTCPFNQITDILRDEQEIPRELGGTCIELSKRFQAELQLIGLTPRTIAARSSNFERSYHVVTVFDHEGITYAADPHTKQTQLGILGTTRNTVPRNTTRISAVEFSPATTSGKLFSIKTTGGLEKWFIDPENDEVDIDKIDIIERAKLPKHIDRLIRVVLPDSRNIVISRQLFHPIITSPYIRITGGKFSHQQGEREYYKLLNQAAQQIGLDPDEVQSYIDAAIEKLLATIPNPN